MKRLILLSIFLWSLTRPYPAMAIYDPRSVPNNKIGIHILFPEEISKAKDLVNNQGKGEWGYVTIPIQASDRNRPKWQKFFDDCKDNKIIPIIRVATTATGSNWDKPENFDLVDFANFLDGLKWPTANRYIIIFNEVNRADEYGGFVNPEDYADILSNASDIFKEKSSDFFILPAGLDNAASNSKKSLYWKVYLERMYWHRPDIFSKIDGWNSHAYPNPDFAARPEKSGSNRINSFKSDLSFLNQFTTKKFPVFITETGWSGKYLSDTQIGRYYDYALKNVWSDDRIVAITPFLINAQAGAFVDFSFVGEDGTFKVFADNFRAGAIQGQPIIASASTVKIAPTPAEPGPQTEEPETNDSMVVLKNLYRNILKLLNLSNR